MLRFATALLVVLASACASSPGSDAAAPSSPPSPAPPPAPEPSPPPAPAAPGPRVCLPVAACNMFVKCALAEEVAAPDGGRAYRVLQYDHHPQRVGELWSRAETCWDARGEHRCAEALQYTSVPCTPVPPAQMELDFACRMEGDRCILVEH